MKFSQLKKGQRFLMKTDGVTLRVAMASKVNDDTVYFYGGFHKVKDIDVKLPCKFSELAVGVAFTVASNPCWMPEYTKISDTSACNRLTNEVKKIRPDVTVCYGDSR